MNQVWGANSQWSNFLTSVISLLRSTPILAVFNLPVGRFEVLPSYISPTYGFELAFKFLYIVSHSQGNNFAWVRVRQCIHHDWPSARRLRADAEKDSGPL